MYPLGAGRCSYLKNVNSFKRHLRTMEGMQKQIKQKKILRSRTILR